MLQLSFNRVPGAPVPLVELREGEEGILERLDLPEEVAHRLMELGFLPGHRVRASSSAPSGDPRVFWVDGCEIALRRETAAHMIVRRLPENS